MRMDRYEDEITNKEENEEEQLSRLERNKGKYDRAYDSSSVVDFDTFLSDDNESIEDKEENLDIKTDTTYEEKNYDINEYLKRAHDHSKPDENVRNLDNTEFKNQEDEILKLIASIDEQKENDEFFSDLIGEDEDTIIEGQLTKEEFTKTTYEEFYAANVKEKQDTKLEKVLTEETMNRLNLEEEENNNPFEDVYKPRKKRKRRKKTLAIVFFSVSLFALIMVIIILILK